MHTSEKGVCDKMKRGTVAVATIFMGVGLLFGAFIGRATTQMAMMSGRITNPFGERLIIQDGAAGEFDRTVEIQVPRVPDSPRLRSWPSVSASPNLSSRIVVNPVRGFFAVVRAVIGAIINLLALAFIAIGVIMFVRRRNQPVEKVPPAVVMDSE
jgi:hypothetical protein